VQVTFAKSGKSIKVAETETLLTFWTASNSAIRGMRRCVMLSCGTGRQMIPVP